MSIITLQYGQCGNQIGQSLYSTIFEDINLNLKQKSSLNSYYWQSSHKWFHITEKGQFEPRSVLIDTEEKVVSNVNKQFSFKFKNIMAKSYGGSANNWAYGYVSRSKLVSSQVLDSVRREAEKCDYVTSLFNIFSSSGGTGSGIGSYVIEQLRDAFPNKTILNAIVLPYIKGEIITQSYNTLLNLAHLYSLSDGIILFENEKLQYLCKYAVNLTEINFFNINAVIAQQIASVMQPVTNDISNTELISTMCVHPAYKFVTLKTEPNYKRENRKFESTKPWSSLIQSLTKQSRFDVVQQKESNIDLKPNHVCNVVITRGNSVPNERDLKQFMNPKEYVSWLPEKENFKMYTENNNFLDFDKFLTLVSNSNCVAAPLNIILDDAWSLFTHSAYLHHYKKYGIDEDAFLNSFQILENVLSGYKNL